MREEEINNNVDQIYFLGILCFSYNVLNNYYHT